MTVDAPPHTRTGATPAQSSTVEQHGFDYIPEQDRYLTPRRLGTFWAGINSYQFFFVLGTVAIAMGLSLVEALAVVGVGSLLYVLVGYSSVAGPRAGLPTMTLSRAPFGVFGNRVNALAAWLMAIGFEVVNGLLGVFAVVALFDELGWHNSGALGKVLATAIVLGVAILIAVVGHRLMVAVQPIIAIAVAVVFVMMLVKIVGKVDWSWAPTHQVHGAAGVALFLSAVAVIASGPLSYLAVSADYSRYLPTRTSTRSIMASVILGGGVMSAFLSVTGVIAATQGDLTDPVAGMKPLLPAWLFVLYIIVSIAGAVSNNVSVFYSSGLSVQALGVPLRRWTATAVDAVIATALVLVVLFVYDFQKTLNDFLAVVNIWAGPFAGVWIIDGVLRRWRYDSASIHTASPASRYWGTRGVNIPGVVALVAGMGVGALTIDASILHGWVSTALDGADLSWILPVIVSAAVYAVLAGRAIRDDRVREAAASAPATSLRSRSRSLVD